MDGRWHCQCARLQVQLSNRGGNIPTHYAAVYSQRDIGHTHLSPNQNSNFCCWYHVGGKFLLLGVCVETSSRLFLLLFRTRRNPAPAVIRRRLLLWLWGGFCSICLLRCGNCFLWFGLTLFLVLFFVLIFVLIFGCFFWFGVGFGRFGIFLLLSLLFILFPAEIACELDNTEITG